MRPQRKGDDYWDDHPPHCECVRCAWESGNVATLPERRAVEHDGDVIGEGDFFSHFEERS